MKLKYKRVFFILACVTLFFAACKKSEQPKPIPPVVSPTIIGRQIAVNIAQTLAGAYGGVNIYDGLVLPGFTTKYNENVSIGPDLFDLCSFSPDTLLSYGSKPGDTIKYQTNGVVKFYFSCDTIKAPKINGYSNYTLLNGYNAYDSLSTKGVAPRDSFIYNVKASYTVKALDLHNIPLVINGSTNKQLSVNGSLKSYVDAKALNKTVVSTSIHAFYVLTDVWVDLTQGGDITAGTAIFGATGSYNNVVWYAKGAITFTGSHQANIVIDNKTYVANLLTGAVTAAN